MQVIFIHHSCFLVEVDEKVLIFDWFCLLYTSPSPRDTR